MFVIGMMLLIGILGEAIVIGKFLRNEKRAEEFEAQKRRNWNNAWI